MNLNLEKGNKLERAIGAIQSIILERNPSLQNSQITFKNKKIIILKGVRHEIDWIIEIDLGNGYKSIFIFECKNRTDSANKNDMIIFSEKIKVFNATKGFFIAHKFTKDACAQAKQDARIELITFTEKLQGLGDGFEAVHYITYGVNNFQIYFEVENLTNSELSEIKSLILFGKLIEIKQFINKILQQFQFEMQQKAESNSSPIGMNVEQIKILSPFQSGELIVNGKECKQVQLRFELIPKLQIFEPTSKFNIEKQGQILEFEKIDLEGNQAKGSSFIFFDNDDDTFTISF